MSSFTSAATDCRNRRNNNIWRKYENSHGNILWKKENAAKREKISEISQLRTGKIQIVL
jgi:hypothetical protein